MVQKDAEDQGNLLGNLKTKLLFDLPKLDLKNLVLNCMSVHTSKLAYDLVSHLPNHHTIERQKKTVSHT